MVEVFKTNIELEQEAGLVLKKIEKQIPNSRITLGFQVSILPDEV